MRLDTDKARGAGRGVLAAKDEVEGDDTAAVLRAAAEGLRGLAFHDALNAAADGYASFTKRFGDELDWLGHTVISAADAFDATDESSKTSIQKLDVA